MPATRPLEDRFWEKVEITPSCWLWTATTDGCGYGLIGMGPGLGLGKAHRISWWLFNGEIPRGLCVLHTCDTPACVRPRHLFLGTQLDNACDREEKGRGKRRYGQDHWTHLCPERLKRGEDHWTRRLPSPFLGSGNPKAKLSREQAEEIRLMFVRDGLSYTELAAQFDVRTSTIGRIIRRETW